MIKKVLFITCLFISVVVFSQKTITKVYAAPNPFTTNTKIFIESTKQQKASLTIKNILGNTVFTKKLKLKKGKNSVPFSKNKLKSGLYIYIVKQNKEVISKRFVIQ